MQLLEVDRWLCQPCTACALSSKVRGTGGLSPTFVVNERNNSSDTELNRYFSPDDAFGMAPLCVISLQSELTADALIASFMIIQLLWSTQQQLRRVSLSHQHSQAICHLSNLITTSA